MNNRGKCYYFRERRLENFGQISVCITNTKGSASHHEQWQWIKHLKFPVTEFRVLLNLCNLRLVVSVKRLKIATSKCSRLHPLFQTKVACYVWISFALVCEHISQWIPH